MNKKNVILILSIAILITGGVIGGVYLVNQRQEIRKKAAPATSIYFQPSTTNINSGETVNLDVLVDINENSLATVSLDINYDDNVLEPFSLTFNLP